MLLLHPVLAAADVIVPANAIGSLNGGTLDLGCTDLIVAGTLQLGGGQVLNARNVTIQPGGVLDGGSGAIELGGNWSNNGGFLAGTGTVRFRDLCALASATISGSSSFANARFVTSIGKNYVFAVGSVHTITGVLEITGTTPQPIQFRSSAPGPGCLDQPDRNRHAADRPRRCHRRLGDRPASRAESDQRRRGRQRDGLVRNPNPANRRSPIIPALSTLMLGVLAALLALVAGLDLRRRTSLPVADTIARRRRAGRTRS